MLAKATLRLPAPLLERLRERSREEGRSLNETAARAIERGLGGTASDEGWLGLGSVLEELPARRYDGVGLRHRWERLGSGTRRLHEDLDWVRGDR
ncbi:MAG TPA: Arc family DNA-binding protein [Terriglobales bacterium]|nr:Arc family DNA-binding protein [Terriglobales bacterium]